MAKQKLYAITNLAAEGSVYLDIGGVSFDVAQFTTSFACNEIPVAQALLAIGRRADKPREAAAIHDKLAGLRQMRPATVYFTPQGEFAPDGTQWPPDREVIFDGYFVGMDYQKIDGKVAVVANLIHWLFDLACSSCLSMNSHPANPGTLTTAAVYRGLNVTGVNPSAFISQIVGHAVISSRVKTDLWGGMKELFAKLANLKARAVAPVSFCTGDQVGNFVVNTRALNALKRIEGPSLGTAGAELDYTYGVPLPFGTLGVLSIERSIANAICQATVESYLYTTFWDKMVGELFPAFHMAIIPMVNTAVVIADTPAYNVNYWKLIRPDDEFSFQQSTALERPLRAVGVMSDYASMTGAFNKVPGYKYTGQVGGCFVAGSVSPDDGVVQYVKPPKWLDSLITSIPAAGTTSGAGLRGTMKTLEFPGVASNEIPADQQYNSITGSANALFGKYAQSVYVSQMLRGKNGSLSGKLRFDIAPGSCIKIVASQERFIGAEDALAFDMFANVARVTIAINCEQSLAGTTLQLSHLRTDAENHSLRFSETEHPLFGESIHGSPANPKSHGCPLIPAYDFQTED